MNIPGIYSLIAQRRQSAEWDRAKAAGTRTDPRLVHELEESAKRTDAEVDRLQTHAKSNEELIQNIEMLIHYLNGSSIKSAHRTLALRDLESASGRLQRELGTKV